MKRIYLAGFEVFAPDAVQRGAKMKMMCAERGFVGLYPFDNEADTAADIFTGNCKLIDQADIVIANLNPFRGDEPDSGTCFEVGYAFAKGKTVYGYVSDGRTMQERLGTIDKNGFAIENFGHPINLMLACAATIVEGDFAAALSRCAPEQA